MYFKNVSQKYEQKTACFFDCLALNSHISDLDLGEHTHWSTILRISYSVLDEKHQRHGRDSSKLNIGNAIATFHEILRQDEEIILFCARVLSPHSSTHPLFCPIVLICLSVNLYFVLNIVSRNSGLL